MDEQQEIDEQAQYNAWIADYIAWLRTTTPDVWHLCALDFNWDNRLDPLYWIVQQAQCDKATALTIFWKACPQIVDADKARAGWSDSWLDEEVIVEHIARRLHEGSFTRAEIAYDVDHWTKDDYKGLLDEVKTFENPLWRPHRDMVRSISGYEIVFEAKSYRDFPEQFQCKTWIDLPTLYIITPDIERAQEAIFYILGNLALFSASIVALRWLDSSKISNWLCLAVVLVGVGWWLHKARGELAILRAIRRSNHMPGLGVADGAIGALVIGAGALAGEMFLIASARLRASPSDGLGVRLAIGAVLLATLLGAAYGAAHWLSRRAFR